MSVMQIILIKYIVNNIVIISSVLTLAQFCTQIIRFTGLMQYNLHYRHAATEPGLYNESNQ